MSDATARSRHTALSTGDLTNRVVSFDRYGGPEVLNPAERPITAPGPGELLVRVAAAGVNPADAALRSGQFRWVLRIPRPFVPGSDVSGVVEAVGPGVTSFRPGDAVYAMLPTATGGGYARYALVAAGHAAPAPTGLPLGDAAAVPLAGLTALQALRDQARLATGADLLVHGASGGVGHLAVQIGTALGARVTAVTSGRNSDLVTSLGAAHVVDYRRQDPTTLGPHFDVVFDAVDKLPFRRSRHLLKPGGTAVTVRPFADKLAPDRLAWTRGGRRLRSVLVRPDADGLLTLSHWITTGRLRPHIEHRYPVTQARDAHERIATGRVRGKLLLTIDPDLATTVTGQAVP